MDYYLGRLLSYGDNCCCFLREDLHHSVKVNKMLIITREIFKKKSPGREKQQAVNQKPM